jgi:hypothetical protein
LDAVSREALRYPTDFLDRPTDEVGRFRIAPDVFFLA